VSAGRFGSVPQVPGRYAGYSDSLRQKMLQREGVKAPTMGQVADVAYDPYAAQGISGVADVQAQMLDMQGLPSTQWQGVDAQQAGQSALQAQMQQQAQAGLDLGGQLSAEDLRASQQSARAAATARGAVGGRSNAAMFAEALNRDVYSRARQGERRGFAQNVEAASLQQRMADAAQANQVGIANAQGQLQSGIANQGTQMQGLLANQQAGMQAGLANQQMGYNVQAFNAGAQNQAGQFNAQMGLQASMANQGVDLARQQTIYGGQMQTNIANQQARQAQYGRDMQAQLANQGAQMQARGQEYAGGLSTALANQGMNFSTQQANQRTGLEAAMANQRTQLGVYDIRSGVGQQRWDFAANARENRAIRSQNMADIGNIYSGRMPIMQQGLANTRNPSPVRPRPATGISVI